MTEHASAALRLVRDAALIAQDVDAELHRLIREAHDAGEAVTRIAEKAGVARQTVYNILGRESSA